jgi:hypothetical protein
VDAGTARLSLRAKGLALAITNHERVGKTLELLKAGR